MNRLSLLIALIGFQTASAQSSLSSADTVAMTRKENSLNEVIVSANARKAQETVENTQMGKIELPVKMLLKAPAIGGEQDVIKALQLTPGVKRGAEGGIGMYVRGGGSDENLILLDGATVYNAGHLLGFFSVFNAASLKDVQMYKSSFPAQYGGRLSSVLDVRTKEGSLTNYKASASIGLISSSVSIQGPILKNKLSAIASVRRTYIDKVFRYIPYHFYDANAKLTYVASLQDRIYLSGYTSADVLKTSNGSKSIADTKGGFRSGMELGNLTSTLRWNHTAESGKYSSNICLLYTRFSYDISGGIGADNLLMRSAIRDYGVKGDFRFYSLANHKISAGFSVTNHFFHPNMVQSSGAPLEKYTSRNGQRIYNNEAAVYVANDYKINSAWQASAGMRLSADFVEGKTYVYPEPRLAIRYLLSQNSSVKASYARMAQYVHLVSSSSLALPTDLWYPVTASIRPGISDQVSLGYYYTFPNSSISISTEAYYKWLQHLVEYREGAQLILNDNYEKELVHGKGRSYGAELFLSKTSGRFTGWVGYSLSYAHRQFDSLNKGQEYYARYDRRHDFSVVGMYDITDRISVSSSVLYATGSPFTGQTGQYVVPKPGFDGFETLPAYTGRNELRLSSSFRVDLDIAYKFSIGRRLKGDFHISMYNLMNRTQPGRVQRVYNEKTQSFTYQQKGLFGNITTAAVNFNL